MRITFRQGGGIAGVSPPPVVIEVDQLPENEANAWRDLITAADFFTLQSTGPSAGGADRLEYTIVVEAEGQCHEVILSEDQIPKNLEPLVLRLRQSLKDRLKKRTS